MNRRNLSFSGSASQWTAQAPRLRPPRLYTMLAAGPMEILFDIGAVIVFLLLIVTVPRALWNEKPEGPGSRLLFGFVILMVIIFATVSLSTAAGLIASSSSLSHIVLLAVWVLVAVLARIAWSPRTAR